MRLTFMERCAIVSCFCVSNSYIEAMGQLQRFGIQLDKEGSDYQGGWYAILP